MTIQCHVIMFDVLIEPWDLVQPLSAKMVLDDLKLTDSSQLTDQSESNYNMHSMHPRYLSFSLPYQWI